MKKVILALLSFVLLAAVPASGQARPGPFWHGGIEHFHEHDIVVWRGGRWFHGWHGSRIGWWWIVGPSWYWYPAPVYPYPNPYTPPVVAEVPPSPPTQPQVLPPTWYYCDRPAGYYPYVPECGGSGWKAVPATPPPGPASALPPPPR